VGRKRGVRGGSCVETLMYPVRYTCYMLTSKLA